MSKMDQAAEPGGSATAGVTSRQRFVDACHCRPTDRPPVWLMRQAGRALPEYRKLKETHSFLEMVQTPELAVEVTLQPIRRFGFDAAILFSDILVIPEAMGQPYRFPETGGVLMEYILKTKEQIEKLSVEGVTERLAYVDKALRTLRGELGDKTALLGFAGSPWTLATFMLEGGSVTKYTRALNLFREDRKTFHLLVQKLTDAVTAYLKMQAAAGVDALQIFDSHGGHLPSAEFVEASGRWMRDIIRNLRADGIQTPVIVFSLGTHANWADLLATGANVLGIDWHTPMARVREFIPLEVGLQGNFLPAQLTEGTPETVAAETRRLLVEMRGRNGYIFNLGHGLPPTAKLENIAALVNTVRDAQHA